MSEEPLTDEEVRQIRSLLKLLDVGIAPVIPSKLPVTIEIDSDPKIGFGKSVDAFLAKTVQKHFVDTPPAQVVENADALIENEDYWIDRLQQDFGALIVIEAKRKVRGWNKMTAKAQHEFLIDKKNNASYDPA